MRPTFAWTPQIRNIILISESIMTEMSISVEENRFFIKVECRDL